MNEIVKVRLGENRVQVGEQIYDFATGLAASSFMQCLQNHDAAACLVQHAPVQVYATHTDLANLAGDGGGVVIGH